ncbi:hypothetical protein MASR2M12_19350 [Bacteroidales bacterium]
MKSVTKNLFGFIIRLYFCWVIVNEITKQIKKPKKYEYEKSNNSGGGRRYGRDHPFRADATKRRLRSDFCL